MARASPIHLLGIVSQNVIIAFGQRIKELRLERNWSQEFLAEKAGMHRNYIGMIERGERNPSLSNIERLAQAFGISLSALFQHVEGHHGC